MLRKKFRFAQNSGKNSGRPKLQLKYLGVSKILREEWLLFQNGGRKIQLWPNIKGKILICSKWL